MMAFWWNGSDLLSGKTEGEVRAGGLWYIKSYQSLAMPVILLPDSEGELLQRAMDLLKTDRDVAIMHIRDQFKNKLEALAPFIKTAGRLP